MELIGVIALFIVICIIFGFISGILYLLLLPVRKYLLKSGRLSRVTLKKINRSYISIVFLIAAWQTYFAIYPMDSFYKDEFKFNTGIELPASANITTKSSWYPDMHGKYWAAAVIKLNENDYSILKSKIAAHENFTVDTAQYKIGVTDDYKTLTKEIKEKDILIVYLNSKKHWFKVAFLNDRKTIIFENNHR